MTDDEKFLAWLGNIKERLEKMRISLLEFDDAGASDEEPVKGVTMGHIRHWHDECVAMESESHRDYQSLEAENGRLSSAIRKVVDTFEKDEAQGYRSRDRKFAIEILKAALNQPHHDGMRQGEK